MTTTTSNAVALYDVALSADEISIEGPDDKESDRMPEGSSTTPAAVQVEARGETGIRLTHCHSAVAGIVRGPRPRRSLRGHGLELTRADAERRAA
jgi:hypothetical protein